MSLCNSNNPGNNCTITAICVAAVDLNVDLIFNFFVEGSVLSGTCMHACTSLLYLAPLFCMCSPLKDNGACI